MTGCLAPSSFQAKQRLFGKGDQDSDGTLLLQNGTPKKYGGYVYFQAPIACFEAGVTRLADDLVCWSVGRMWNVLQVCVCVCLCVCACMCVYAWEGCGLCCKCVCVLVYVCAYKYVCVCVRWEIVIGLQVWGPPFSALCAYVFWSVCGCAFIVCLCDCGLIERKMMACL